MDSRAWVLTDRDLRAWIQRMVDSGSSVVAPVEEDGVLIFRPVTAADRVVIEPSGKTRWSPKEFLFPRSEALYGFRFRGDLVEIRDPDTRETDQVLFAVRSCDAAGLARLDDVFLSGIRDPFYAARRERTTVVGAACAAAEADCFCTAVGGSPVAREGVDLLLIPGTESWLLRVVTERGETLVRDASEAWRDASAADLSRVDEIESAVASQIVRSPIGRDVAPVLESGFAHPVWDQLARHCVGCSICSYVCPSCSCFDMNHRANAWCGEQVRSWDACTFELFTRHASGHNPRASRQQRYRQRVLHKYAFRGDDGCLHRCAGCGRCISLCPAGIDIAECVMIAAAAIQQEAGDAGC